MEAIGKSAINFELMNEISSHCEEVQSVINNSKDKNEKNQALNKYQRYIESFIIGKSMENFELTQLIYNTSLQWIRQHKS